MATALEDLGRHLVAGEQCVAAVGEGLHYRELPPPAALASVAACVWRSSVAPGAEHVHRVLPDGCVELVFSRGRPALVYGPREDWFDVALAAGSEHVGLRLRGGAAGGLLGLDAAELAGRVVELDALGCAPRAGELPPGLALSRVAAALARRTVLVDRDPVASRGPALLAAAPSLAVGRHAEQLGLSERQFRRRFTRATGLSPAAYARIARVDGALRTALGHPGWSWTAVAYEHGFSDQAHLSRAVHHMTGAPPSAILRTTPAR